MDWGMDGWMDGWMDIETESGSEIENDAELMDSLLALQVQPNKRALIRRSLMGSKVQIQGKHISSSSQEVQRRAIVGEELNWKRGAEKTSGDDLDERIYQLKRCQSLESWTSLVWRSVD
ncbi:uncharacterized protein PGTG_04329 [Puccinia graminis f. sp. tritici CRL 75-36-700-3]|uniref:Uncharacterized protein n=1 Tax=Puccinia graminis f. sp. tritici (strain CRL 75-36-700-3 / race SCCL) TaxID=418459 RepID=E3K204_PUCGT|nr:uncharacterized protein PGTG_04329 [Puccinia graminis f. sp. tritici CRL 75-36-700-3]EFP78373.1 hypothetical protein PGTG_04329 [Puccinia graminis f. sp. tritici CRL 75-36-700-3]